jgi:hypothetical protein
VAPLSTDKRILIDKKFCLQYCLLQRQGAHVSEHLKHDFSNRTLSLAEAFQEKAGHSGIGRAVIRAITGSSSDNYAQLNWFSSGVQVEGRIQVTVNGDPTAGRVPRFWNLAFILGSSNEALADLYQHAGRLRKHEAVAYVTQGDVWHVGAHPNQPHLFRESDNGEGIIAMRHGRSPASVSMGLWLPDERVYLGSYGTRVVEQEVPLSDLSSRSVPPILT